MRKLLVLLGAITFATTFTVAVQAQPIPQNCRWESGVILPNMQPGALKGPFLVLSLTADVDPASPKRAWVVWSRENRWFSVDDFKGPFFLAPGEMLLGRNDFTTRGAIYSGCRL